MWITLHNLYFTIMTCNGRFWGFTVTCLFWIFQLEIKKCEVAPVHATKAYRGSRGIAPLLTSALCGGEWSATCPGHFTPRKEPWYLLNRRLDGSQRCSGLFWRTQNLLPLPGLNPRASSCSDYTVPAFSVGHWYMLFREWISNSCVTLCMWDFTWSSWNVHSL